MADVSRQPFDDDADEFDLELAEAEWDRKRTEEEILASVPPEERPAVEARHKFIREAFDHGDANGIPPYVTLWAIAQMGSEGAPDGLDAVRDSFRTLAEAAHAEQKLRPLPQLILCGADEEVRQVYAEESEQQHDAHEAACRELERLRGIADDQLRRAQTRVLRRPRAAKNPRGHHGRSRSHRRLGGRAARTSPAASGGGDPPDGGDPPGEGEGEGGPPEARHLASRSTSRRPVA